MGFADYLVLGIILLVILGGIYVMYRSKKQGKKCIGCPDSGSCSGKCSCSCGASACSSRCSDRAK